MSAPDPVRVKLSTPIEVDGDTISEIVLHEPNGKGMRLITRAVAKLERDETEFSNVDLGMVQLSAMSDLDESALDLISMTDLRVLMGHLPALMGADPNDSENET